MFVFVDSTEFTKDPYAGKMSWDWLGEWCGCDRARIVIPKIVIDEVATQFRNSLTRLGRSLNRGLHRIGILLPNVEWSLPPILTDGAEDQYREALAKRLEILRVEQPDHVGPMLATFPGRSIKATLMSQMILDRLSGTNETVVLITSSSRDFGTTDNVDPEFLADLERRGIRRDQFQIYRSLFDFVKSHVEPRLRKRDKLIDAIEAGTHPFDSNQLFLDQYNDIFEMLSDVIEGWGDFPWHFNTADFGSPELVELSTIPEHFQIDILDMDGDQFIMFVRYWVDGIVSCTSKRSDIDAGHSGRVTFEIQGSILLDMKSGEVENVEIGEDCAFKLWLEDWPDTGRSGESESA